jgi:hypothetical protein
MFRDCDAKIIRDQIGMMNVFAISGGRWTARETGITLPVSNGYSVTVDLTTSDDYTVRRVYTRAGKVTIKGEYTGVHWDAVGELAYQASCFHNVKMPAAV